MGIREHDHLPIHSWLKTIRVFHLPGWSDDVLQVFFARLLVTFDQLGNRVLESPSGEVELVLASARFGEAVSWRTAPLFNLRKRFQLDRLPALVTVVHATREEFSTVLDRLEKALRKTTPDPADFIFSGLSENAYLTLYEQGQRGGAILALERLLQAQTKSIRMILVVGDDKPELAYSFDLVGAYPRSEPEGQPEFYMDLAYRLMTALSTREITDHAYTGSLVSRAQWENLVAPRAMVRAGHELGIRGFFSDLIRINDLVSVPSLPESIASQYSEGCFATWEPVLEGIVITVTGSARPVRKNDLQKDDMSVVVGIRGDQRGALVCQVEGSSNSPPSSEAVELFEVDRGLPPVFLGPEWTAVYGELEPEMRKAPAARSKLHGHRSVASFDPSFVEYVPLAKQYHHYPVSCASEAQARAIQDAFSASKALQSPGAAPQVVFTVLPGHGIVILEKWDAGKSPFQLIWEAMDSAQLQIASQIPQGPFDYAPDRSGRMVIRT